MHKGIRNRRKQGERVKIAIIDTRVDLENPFIRASKKRIRGEKSWVDDGNGIMDSSGHGTYIAGLLLKVAPEADIYIARVAKSGVLNKTEDIAEVYSLIPENHYYTNIMLDYQISDEHL